MVRREGKWGRVVGRKGKWGKGERVSGGGRVSGGRVVGSEGKWGRVVGRKGK